MLARQEEMKQRNLQNRLKHKKSLNFANSEKPKQSNATKPKQDYEDFNKFIAIIKDTKTKKNKIDLMLEFIKQEAEEINETIK
tara:strand:- start:1195 stop:1443 length:249 start_codon:yes stop_codon:yes gene_type:complete